MAGVFGGSKYSKNFEINLDSPFAVFYGDQHEAEPVTLAGSLVLDSPDYMSVRSIKIKLEGKWKVSWSIAGGTTTPQSISNNNIRDKGILISEEQSIFPSGMQSASTHRIASGRHEWRFKFVLDPSLPESIEGLSSSHVVYNLTAEIDRGYMSKALVARKHVRVIRTLSRDMSETMPFPYSNEDTWVDKVRYHIYIPSRYYAFGTSVPVDFTLFPLQKGIRIGKIKMELLERVGLETGRISEEAYATTLNDRVVASTESQVPANASQLIESTSGVADESSHFRLTLPLKKSLKFCRQSVSSSHIKIHHNLKIYVNIHNPDGHVSQLCLRNLIHLYISPHTPINDDQTMATPITAVQNANGTITDIFDSAPPPTYGTHILDQLYDDVDTSAFMSGVNTPYNLLSRAQSRENLASFFGTPNSSQPGSRRASGETLDPAAIQLQARLQALQDRRPSISSISGDSPPMPTIEFPDTTNPDPIILLDPATPHTSNSQYSHAATLLHRRSRTASARNSLQFDLEALSRTPSYNTAIQAPPSHISAHPDGLPTYDFAIGLSTPNSPRQVPHTGGPPTPPSSSSEENDVFPRLSCPPLTSTSTTTTRTVPFRESPSPPGESNRGSSAFLTPHYNRVNAPQRAHVRGRSIAAVVELRRAENEQARPRRPSLGVVVGGGSLAGLWGGGGSGRTVSH